MRYKGNFYTSNRSHRNNIDLGCNKKKAKHELLEMVKSETFRGNTTLWDITDNEDHIIEVGYLQVTYKGKVHHYKLDPQAF